MDEPFVLKARFNNGWILIFKLIFPKFYKYEIKQSYYFYFHFLK